jgi:hypothetical protein
MVIIITILAGTQRVPPHLRTMVSRSTLGSGGTTPRLMQYRVPPHDTTGKSSLS